MHNAWRAFIMHCLWIVRYISDVSPRKLTTTVTTLIWGSVLEVRRDRLQMAVCEVMHEGFGRVWRIARGGGGLTASSYVTNLKHQVFRVSCSELMCSGWVVTTCHSPRNSAHAYLSHPSRGIISFEMDNEFVSNTFQHLLMLTVRCCVAWNIDSMELQSV